MSDTDDKGLIAKIIDKVTGEYNRFSSRQRWRMAFLLLLDTFLIQVSVIVALALRFEGEIPTPYLATYINIAPWFTIIILLLFAWRGLYFSLWRYAGMEELGNIVAASSLSSTVLILLTRFYAFPRMVLIMQWCLIILLLAGSRLALRTLRRVLIMRERGESFNLKPTSAQDRHSRLLIIGADGTGADLVTQLKRSRRNVIGFIDDDPHKQLMKIHGIPVIGTTADLATAVQRYGIDEVLLSQATTNGDFKQRVVDALTGLNVKLHIIPSVNELIDGKVTINELRPISIEDLLGREPVKLNVQQISEQLKDQVVLITGAGGSIGSELCRQVCRYQPKLLLMLGHGENSIFEAVLDMDKRFPNVPKAQIIADVRDKKKIDSVFAQYRPNYVLHAAAHKHVTFMENNPDEAVKTNIFGTQNVALSALKYGATKFVMISTDKAVNPSSVMGATKRVAEMVVQDLNGKGRTRFISVRFGNVLGSRGSVVPVFRYQIAKGGPVTVRHPDMERYFMTIPEAAQLVLQAAAIGKGGEVFVLDMGKPVKIVDLARNLILLSGYRPDKDIKIVFTGPLPGEKLREEILMTEEGTDVTEHSRIFIAKNATCSPEILSKMLAVIEEMAFRTGGDLKMALKMLVPSYTPYIEGEARALVAAAGEEEGS